MSYQRVIPRDLFNEANLLKCYGQLYLNLERMRLEDCMSLNERYDHFIIHQNEDGMLTVASVDLLIRGERLHLWRPLNSRRPWPLYLHPAGYEGDADPIEVFDDDGNFTAEMKAFLVG